MPEYNVVTAKLGALAQARMKGSASALATSSPDVERFLLEHGRSWPWREAALPPGVRPGYKAGCFYNSQHLALANARYIYVEGYATCDDHEPCDHAWCVDVRTQEVIDVVWLRSWRDRIYFGIPFRTEFVRRFRELETTGNLRILRWSSADWPVQTGRYPESDWLQQFIPRKSDHVQKFS